MNHVAKLILSFLYKYFFILKAASDGWKIRYVGGDQFQFLTKVKYFKNTETEYFIRKYSSSLLNSRVY